MRRRSAKGQVALPTSRPGADAAKCPVLSTRLDCQSNLMYKAAPSFFE